MIKILVVGSFKYQMYSKALYDAFKNLGMNVQSFDLDKFDYSGNNTFLNLFERFQKRFIVGPKIKKINNNLLDIMENEEINLVFLYRAIEIEAITVRKIKKSNCIIFSYNNDDPLSDVPSKSYWKNYMQSINFCDHNFVYRNKNLNDFKKIGIENVSILKSYYIKKNNYPLKFAKTLDVVFLGHFENDGRDEYIKTLIEAGINVTVFGGAYWKKAPLYDEIKHVIKEKQMGEKYNSTINKAKIALVFLSKINSDTYTRRCFEIPATKTLMLSEYSEDLNSMFKHNKEAVYFKNKEDLLIKCQYLLDNPLKIEAIGNAGYKRLLKDNHSVECRAKEILKIYSEKKKILKIH